MKYITHLSTSFLFNSKISDLGRNREKSRPKTTEPHKLQNRDSVYMSK